MTGGATGGARPVIRETYQEYDDEDGTVAVIADPDTETAWIESDLVQEIVE